MTINKTIKIGARNSQLALKQAEEAIEYLGSASDGNHFDVQGYTTTGDRIQDRTLYDIGGKALFLKEVEAALYARDIDIAVHSLKDVPGIESEDLKVAAILERRDARDVLISKVAKNIMDLPKNAVVGTSSMRRIVFLKAMRPDLTIKDIRGNIVTRLEKWRDGQYDAIILAAAGLQRLSLMDEYCHILDPTTFIPAVGQGNIALQIRNDDQEMEELCMAAECKDARILSSIERAFLTQLSATCKTPTSAYAYFVDKAKQQITVHFMLAGKDLAPHILHRNITLGKDYPKGSEYLLGQEVAQELQTIVQNNTELL